MSDAIEPIKSVEDARQYAAAVLANPCIPQAMHHAFGEIGVADAIDGALRRDSRHLPDAVDARLSDADYTLFHSRDLNKVDPSLPEADRQAIEQIRQQAGKQLIEAAHPFNDAAMPPKPASCRGR